MHPIPKLANKIILTYQVKLTCMEFKLSVFLKVHDLVKGLSCSNKTSKLDIYQQNLQIPKYSTVECP
jgi:hypothetical protein